jgi:D-alanyl-D-alanine dipeptidase
MQGGARANRALPSYPPICPFLVMPGLVPGIHVFNKFAAKQDVDGRNKSGHDGLLWRRLEPENRLPAGNNQ